MKVKAYCGYFVGPPRWHGTEVYEPDECQWEAEVDVDDIDWAEGYAFMRCPRCGGDLAQSDDHFGLVQPGEETE